jgi:predicted RNase H-like nuclease (RuvC/YqgF family)
LSLSIVPTPLIGVLKQLIRDQANEITELRAKLDYYKVIINENVIEAKDKTISEIDKRNLDLRREIVSLKHELDEMSEGYEELYWAYQEQDYL